MCGFEGAKFQTIRVRPLRGDAASGKRFRAGLKLFVHHNFFLFFELIESECRKLAGAFQ